MICTISGDFGCTGVIGTVSSDLGGASVIKTVGGEFACTDVIGAIGGEGGRTGVVVTVRSDSRFGGESSRACAVVAIGGEGVGGQYRQGQGEDQFGFHGRCSRCVGVVCLGVEFILRRLIRLKSANKCLKQSSKSIYSVRRFICLEQRGGWVEPIRGSAGD